MEDRDPSQEPPRTGNQTWLQEKAPGLHRFLTRRDGKWPLLRELIVVAVLLVLLASALWGFTGQRFPSEAPVVVVESSSMMHCDQGLDVTGRVCEGRYGRLGTIDPGDLIFVVKVEPDAARERIVPWAEAPPPERYGMPGDVIIFQRNGEPGTPIIHRAMFWLEVHGDGTYSVPGLDVQRGSLEDLKQVLDGKRDGMRMTAGCTEALKNHLEGLQLGAEDSGFVTKGDNNRCFDQTHNGGQRPVQPEWLLGKARGELPWIGVIKLKVGDWTGGTDNVGRFVPPDIKVMLTLTVIVVVGAPFAIEYGVRAVQHRRGPPPGGEGGGSHPGEEGSSVAPSRRSRRRR